MALQDHRQAGRRRFKLEARSVAALNHPDIVTIHSVEEAGGVHFLAMELVDGQSLDQFQPPAGVPVESLFPLAIQIADALAAAHDKGITHRDLKPAKVMVTDLPPSFVPIPMLVDRPLLALPAEHTARAVFTGDWARVFARMLMNLGFARRRARGPDRDVEVTVRI